MQCRYGGRRKTSSFLDQVVARDPTEQAPATPFLSSSRNDIQGLYAGAWNPNNTKYQPHICDVLAAPSSVLSDRQQDIARRTHPEIHRTVAGTKRSANVTTLRRRAPVV